MSVDDMVGGVLDRLDALGEQDTLIVFTTDNGFMWGDHGLINKGFPYTQSAKLPLMMRYAPPTVPGLDRRPAGGKRRPRADGAAGGGLSACRPGRSTASRCSIPAGAATAHPDRVPGRERRQPRSLPAACRTGPPRAPSTTTTSRRTCRTARRSSSASTTTSSTTRTSWTTATAGDGVPSTGDDLCAPAHAR